MKRFLTLLLVATMVIGMFTACVPTNQQGTGSQGGEQGDGTVGKVTYPIETNVTLTMFRNQNSNITSHFDSFGDTPVAQYLAKATGIEVEYMDTYADYDAFWNDMLSTGNYTDLISFNPVTYEGGAVDVIADGLGIELNDVIDKYMPNFKAYLAANPDVDKAIKTDDGIYYYIPYVNSNTGAYSYGAYYREDMLKAMGETEPTTMEEWYDLLVKVKNTYNIIPVSCQLDGLTEYGMMAMAYGVGHNSTSNHFAVDSDGKVFYQRGGEEWKAFLKEMNKWYEEGLIDTDVAAIKSADVNAKMIQGNVFLSMGWLTGAMQNVQVGGAQKIEGFQLKAVGTPALTAGQQIEYSYATTLVSGVGTTISSTCENVEMAARFLDYLFSEEGHLAANYGEPGVGYDMVDGVPTFHEDVVKGDKLPEGYNQSQSAARYSAATTGQMAMVKDEYYYEQLMDEECCAEAIYIWMNSAVGGGHMHELPNLTYDEDEAEAIADTVANLKTASGEWATQFIRGEKDVDEDWDDYIEAIEGMGLKAALIIMNDAMERYSDR